MTLDPTLRQEIVTFLSELDTFHSDTGRKAILLTARLDSLLPTLTLQGKTSQVVPLLVDELARYGLVPDQEQPALICLLQAVKTQVGKDNQQILQRFCEQIIQKQKNLENSPQIHFSETTDAVTYNIHVEGDYFEHIHDHAYVSTRSNTVFTNEATASNNLNRKDEKNVDFSMLDEEPKGAAVLVWWGGLGSIICLLLVSLFWWPAEFNVKSWGTWGFVCALLLCMVPLGKAWQKRDNLRAELHRNIWEFQIENLLPQKKEEGITAADLSSSVNRPDTKSEAEVALKHYGKHHLQYVELKEIKEKDSSSTYWRLRLRS